MRLDNIFRLADNSLALIDYESIYRHKNKIKYLNYIVRTLKKNDLIDNIQKPLRMIVIYTGDVQRTQTDPHLDVGCLQFTIEEVFLSELDPIQQIEATLTDKIKAGILVFTDKVISKQDSEDIWRWIDMTKVGRIFEREKIEYARQETQKALAIANKEKQDALDRASKEKQDALVQATKDSSLAIARRMLAQGIPVTIIQCSIPDLTYNEIISLK